LECNTNQLNIFFRQKRANPNIAGISTEIEINSGLSRYDNVADILRLRLNAVYETVREIYGDGVMRILQFCIAAFLSVVSANASDTSKLKPAFLDDGSKNGLVVYRPDVMPSPEIDDPVRLISISRKSPGHPFNSPEQDANRLFKFLKSNEGFLPSMIAALIGSENEVSFLLFGKFKISNDENSGQKIQLKNVESEFYSKIVGIDLTDYARYWDKQIALNESASKQIFGSFIKGDTKINVVIQTILNDPSNADKFFDTVKLSLFSGDKAKFRSNVVDRVAQISIQVPFDKNAASRTIIGICTIAKSDGHKCQNWSASLATYEFAR
jgi:hypothetical protein